jgi:hypothetical protein
MFRLRLVLRRNHPPAIVDIKGKVDLGGIFELRVASHGQLGARTLVLARVWLRLRLALSASVARRLPILVCIACARRGTISAAP